MASQLGYGLPVPDIQEDQLQHSFKSNKDQSFRVRPPKLRIRYHDLNSTRGNTSLTAQAISFKEPVGASNTSLLGEFYDPSLEESYFDQCFMKICKIGEGSFGEVFKVQSKEDFLFYAVKKSKQYFRSETYRQERLEEVRRYEQFSDNENCVRLYKAWEQDDRLYMQMELCKESLDNYLRRKQRLPEEKIWSVLLDLLLALKSLHDKNLIHLDIKLDNVLIGEDGLCKLADFGLVIDVDKAKQQATEGDCRYIAPELLQGNFSKAADIFSLGIAILELCTYIELPANGLLWQELRCGILPEDFLTCISLDMKELIKSMMSSNPLSRPTVDQLLSNTRLVRLMQIRRRWDPIRKIKQSYRRSVRAVWSTLCNFKNLIYKFVFLFVANLKINDAIEEIDTNHCSNNSSSDTSFDFSCTPETPSRFSDYSTNLVNSTPLNQIPNLRLRKDLTKSSFKLNFNMDSTVNEGNCDEFDKIDISIVQGRKLFDLLDDKDSE